MTAPTPPAPGSDPGPGDPGSPTGPGPGDALAGLFGAGDGGPDLSGLLAQAQAVVAAQARAAAEIVEGVAGGGAVRIEATGTGQVTGVHIDPAAVDPDDVAMLEDLVLAALGDLNDRLARLQHDALGGLGGLLGGG